MGSALARANNLGTIYDKNGNGLGTYTDVAGVTQDIGTLTTAYTEQVTAPLGSVDYSHPFVGAREAISMSVDIALSTATSIQMKLQGRYDASAAWADIQLVRQDTGAVAAVVNFAAAGTYLVQFNVEFSDTGAAQVVIPAIYKSGVLLTQTQTRSAPTGGQIDSRILHNLAIMTSGGATNYIEAFLTGTANTTVKGTGTAGTRLTITRIP